MNTTITMDAARAVALQGHQDYDPDWKEVNRRTIDEQLDDLRLAKQMATLEERIDEDARTISSLVGQGAIDAIELEDAALVNNA